MAQLATVYATTNHRHIGDATGPIVKNFYALASTFYVAGQFVTIDAAGRVAISAANDAAIDGIVYSSVDNSAGANDAEKVPVIVKGNVWVDMIIASAGVEAMPATIGAAGGNYGDGTVASTGQAVLFSSGLGNKKFISLGIQAVGTLALVKRKILCFFLGSGKFS